MVRKVSSGLPAQAKSSHGNHSTKDLPPPSTIAAQIVHNRSNATREEPEHQELFGKLLQEYLKDPIVEETSLETNAQLISVVAEAGLDALRKGDPFSPDAATRRAVDSLQVIQLTVQRSPRILFFNGSTTALDGSKPPLILWLLPKVLGLAELRRTHTIQAQITSFLSTCIDALLKSTQLWCQGKGVVHLIRTMIQDILSALESQTGDKTSRRDQFSISLPSPQAISSLWENAQISVALPQGYQWTISDSIQAKQTVGCLLCVLAHMAEPISRSSSMVGNDLVPWILDCCRQLLMTSDGLRKEYVMQFGEVLESVCNIAAVITSIQGLGAMRIVILDLSADLLSFAGTIQNPRFESALARLLMSFLELDLSSPRFLNARFKERVCPLVTQLIENGPGFSMLGKDLQYVLGLWTDAFPSHKTLPLALNDLHEAIRSESFSGIGDSGLVERLARMSLKLKTAAPSDSDDHRPAKRLRLESSVPPSWQNEQYTAVLDDVYKLCSIGGQEQLEELSGVILSLPEEFRCRLLELLAIFPCAGSQSLIENTPKQILHAQCSICDNFPEHASVQLLSSWNSRFPEDVKAIVSMLEILINDQSFRRSKRQRVLTANLLRRVLAHVDDQQYLQLGSVFGEWCMRSLQSSIRELRVAAAHALMSFIDESLPTDLRTANRVSLIEFLRTLSDRNSLLEQDTLIFAWGLVGRKCGQKELNLVLLRLVEYLGHPQALICGAAFSEIASLAEALNKSVGELFRPFWRSIAIVVVKDIFSCPQKVQQLSDLLSTDVDDLLLLTQAETIPYLTLTKRKEVLERIASARGPSTRIKDLWMQPPKNVAAVVSSLLLHHSSDTEKAILTLLREVDPDFTENDLLTLVNIDPIFSACEILKATGDGLEIERNQVHQALKTLATITERKAGNQKSSSKSDKMLLSFLDNQLLGIMAHFSDIIDVSRDRQTTADKKRCLHGVEALIAISKGHVNIALPQIRATLHSAFASPELVDLAFAAWSVLLASVDEETIEPLIDQTFALIVQNWTSFSSTTQNAAHDTVADLLKTHNSLIRDRIEMLPSLHGIDLLQKFDSEIERLKIAIDPLYRMDAFIRRCQDENADVVHQGLKELVLFLGKNQRLVHDSATSQQPNPVISQLYRALLEASIKFKEGHTDVLDLCGQCLGILGSIDPNKIESIREKKEVLMLSSFDKAAEVIDFVAFMLETVLVPAFHSATSGKSQTYLAYVMQELLKFCGFRQAVLSRQRPLELNQAHQRWIQIPETVRSTLTPYLNSKYFFVNPSNTSEKSTFPLFSPDLSQGSWIRSLVFNLLLRANGENAQMIFPVLSRVIWGHDIAISVFLLPFVVQNIIVGGSDIDFKDVENEIQSVLLHDISNLSHHEIDSVKQCSENIFQVLDYLSRWLQEKRRLLRDFASGSRKANATADFDELTEVRQISKVERLLAGIPPNGLSKRAMQCGSYARALFHWEQFIRKIETHEHTDDLNVHYKHLQDIYAQIEEPDGIEGISAQLHILDPEQQILEHKRAGRWTAVQSWYELALAENPDDGIAQNELLLCLKASGQHESLLNLAERWAVSKPSSSARVLPFAAESAWITGKWDVLERLLISETGSTSSDFNVGIGKALLALRQADTRHFESILADLRVSIIGNLSPAATASLAGSHANTLKLHALYEIATIGSLADPQADRSSLIEILDRRIELLGAYTDDKQYLLGIRRATMHLAGFTKQQIAAAWLTSSRLARKANVMTVAYDAVLHATKLHDEAATIEHARILWKDGHYRKAINNLKGAIEAGVFQSYNIGALEDSVSTTDNQQKQQNMLVSKTQLLLAKWLDQAGLIGSIELLEYYQRAQQSYNKSQSPTYHLGKYYNKILDAEKAAPRAKQRDVFLSGECVKLAIDNYLRSMVNGAKYYYETVPKVLTFWLDFGSEVFMDEQRRLTQIEQTFLEVRQKRLELIHKQLQKYIDRLPPYIWYTALPQIMSRINHAHPKVAEHVSNLIKKIVSSYPQQAMWSLLAVAKAKDPHKAARAGAILAAIRNMKGKSQTDLNGLVLQGQKLTDALLSACEHHINTRVHRVSLQKDLGLKHSLAPCQLVVPIETTMVASLPTVHNSQAVRSNKPFPLNAVTIAAFQDDVLVLSSLQRPRKITLRGSDGQLYGLLCKPKDDLRKDQRLMEFNTMISRALKWDIQSSKRRLYIRTFGVTPLNEECGAIEWVDGLKPMRDIIMSAYKTKDVKFDYGELRQLLDRACADPDRGSFDMFTNTIIPRFPPVLYEWFIGTFPEPESWFAARLRYTRSAAVMSIVGHTLGLGDRHGENILLEEGTGGVFHVDFNCLFDKGLTFEKPELVPFRLTHNMIDAMGAYGYEGPFRTAAELTLKCLRQYQDTLMTILETFLYDPTTDFVGKPVKRKTQAVPETPSEVLESVRSKIRGLLPGENVPLSVDGYVDALIRMAVDPSRLAAMYIGWCAFF